MRTIKFLGLELVVVTVVAVAVTAVAMSAGAQTNVPAGAFPALDRMARFEARRLEQLQGRRFASSEVRRESLRSRLAQRGGFAHRNRLGARGLGWRPRVGLHAPMSPEQRALARQFRAQRRVARAQVLDGKLSREQARKQLKAWVREHRTDR